MIEVRVIRTIRVPREGLYWYDEAISDFKLLILLLRNMPFSGHRTRALVVL